jgi:GR25 family glycosyltransferase involved in LPS biosynthesis
MSTISRTLVLSLPQDGQRKQHIRKHFSEVGLSGFKFFRALAPDSKEVISAYNLGLVKKFPNCFRCGQLTCSCENNVLIPQQVANVLSFKQLWESIRHTGNEWTLVCEDDVHFYPNGFNLLKELLKGRSPDEQPSLIRISQSGLDSEAELNYSSVELSDEVVMSNSAYVLNGHMANYLCQKFGTIETTSDIWVHKQIAQHQGVKSITVSPLLATDLSFNPKYAKFVSRIHPKGINEDDLARKNTHVKRVETEREYELLLSKWTKFPAPKQWNYLTSEPFQMRYMLAAGLLRNFHNILEIGSYRTPIYKFIQRDDVRIKALDPMIANSADSDLKNNYMVDYRASERNPFDGEPYAILILGLDLPVTGKLKEMIANADMAVLEYPEDQQWKRSRETYDELKRTTPFNELMSVSFGLEDNDFSLFDNENEWPPRTQRFIKVVSTKFTDIKELKEQSPCIEPLGKVDTSGSKLLNTDFIASAIFPEAAYEFSHSANAEISYLGGGILYYSLCHMFRSATCVCLGTGGAFVPRLMRQAQRDMGMADRTQTIIVDGNMGGYGRPNWLVEGSFFKRAYPEVDVVIMPTAEAAVKFKKDDLKIDYLHIDADHSYEGALKDFKDFLPLMNKGSVITFHDTKIGSHPSVTCGEALEDIRNMGFEVVDFDQLGSGVAIIKVP